MDKKVASVYQKYKTQYPLLLKMWNDKKAKSSTPYDYDGKINFKCEYGHEFTCTIDEFIKRCDARNIYSARFNSFHLPCPICEAKLKNDFLEILDSKESNDPSDIIADREYFESMENKIKENLSDFELQVLHEYEKGKTYAAIAEKLNTKTKSVDTAIQRIRKKANKIKENIG